MSRLLVVAALVSALGCGTSAPTTAPVTKAAAAPGTAPGPVTTGGAPKGTPVAPTFPPDDWTHKELAEHLAKKGVKAEVLPIPELSTSGQTVASFTEGNGRSTVYLCADTKAAREKAGSLGSDAFASGRFAFGPSAFGDGKSPPDLALLKKLAAALK